ncbi:MAG TPA: hypothetical protein VFG68_03140, partial [Fimbriiglobus sp.]|nr:hypothetical protein [Fimbriiglobus sp.]
YRDLAQDRGGGPATLVLAGLVAARVPWGEPGTWPDRASEIKALHNASNLYRKAIEACQSDVAGRTDELLLLYDRTAAVTVRLADEETDLKKKAELWDSLDALAADFRKTLPGRLEGLRYAARALEGRAPAQSDQRFTPTGAYARADQMYAWSGGLFGSPPAVQLSRGRNLLKWTADEYRAGDRSGLKTERLSQSEQLLRAVTDRQDVGPAVQAEAHYQLGKATLLWYDDETKRSEKSKLLARAMGSFKAALDAAGKLDEDPWTETILRTVYNTATSLSARQAGRQLSDTEVETTAKFLDELADRKGPRPLTPTWQAALKVRAARLRDGADPKAVDWFPNIRVAAEKAVPSGRDCEADLRLGLLLTLAEGYGAEQTGKKHIDPEKAIEYADKAVALTRSHPELPADERAEAFGSLGFLRFEIGLAHGEKRNFAARDKEWSAANGRLADALDLAPNHSRAWKWQYAQSVIAVAEAKANEAKPDRAATAAVRALHLYRQAELAAFGLLNQPGADPDDLAMAKKVWGSERAACYRKCRPYIKAGLDKAGGKPEAVLWRLAEAELACAMTGKFADGTAERTELNTALKAVRDSLGTQPADVRKLSEQMTTRIEDFLTRFAN